MPASSRIPQVVVIAVLILHGLWILNHLRWVATKQINPWKLGGYGMYTVPSPNVTLALLDLRNPAAPRRIDRRTYSTKRFRAVSIDREFRCAHIRSGDLKVFFEDNPQFRGVNLGFVFLERILVKNPIAVKRVGQGLVTIVWITNDFFEFTSEFCGNQETGKVALL
jgi:hypothetical protein